MANNYFESRMTTARLAIWFVLIGLSSARSLLSEVPSIESVESPAIQRGTSDRLKIIGANLAGTREVVFYDREMSCQSIEAKSDEELTIQLSAGPDCPTGMHAFRLRTDEGFSELRTFTVTSFPVIRSADEKLKVAKGVSLVVDLRDGRAHRYPISLCSGQRLAVDVEAIRLGIDMIDTELRIFDPSGQLIAREDDSYLYRQDPIASILAKQTGEYTLEIGDAGRNAGDECMALVHLSDGPRPTSVFPLGAQPGSSAQLTFGGDCRGTWTSNQQIPSLDQNEFAKFQLFAEQDGTSSPTPIPFRISPLPNINESANNDTWLPSSGSSFNEAPMAINGIAINGIAINGIIEQPLDRDCIWLQGVSGQAMDVEVFAYRLGSAADTLLTVVDSQHNVIAQSDDVDSLDSRAVIVVPKDGKLGIAIEEKRGKGGDAFTYRIEVAPVQTTAEVFLPRRDRLTQDLQTVAVPVGNRVLALMAVRKDEAAGETTIRFPQLPKGTIAHFTQPRADQAIIPVVFESAADAELSGQLVPVDVSVYSATGTTVGHFRQVTDLVRGPADAIYREVNTDRLALCTRAAYPVSIQVSQPKAALVQDGTLGLTVTVERQSNFTGDVVLTLPWLPAWIDAEPKIVIPANQSQAVIQLRAWSQAELAIWPLVVEASASNSAGPSRARRASGGGGGAGGLGGDTPPPTGLSLQSIASLPIQLTVAQSPAKGHFELAAAEQGETIDIVCTIEAAEQLRSVTNLVASLEFLPNRVECEAVSITSESQQVRFKVQVPPTAPLGQYAGLACRLSGKLDGEPVSYVVARDGVITIEQPGQIMRDANGRPLNRVEALRKKTLEGKAPTNVR